MNATELYAAANLAANGAHDLTDAQIAEIDRLGDDFVAAQLSYPGFQAKAQQILADARNEITYRANLRSR